MLGIKIPDVIGFGLLEYSKHSTRSAPCTPGQISALNCIHCPVSFLLQLPLPRNQLLQPGGTSREDMVRAIIVWSLEMA